MSVAQIVDRLLFAENAELRGEFDRVFASLFKNDAVYRKIVFALSKKEGGMSREELLSRLDAEKGGRWTRRLEELEQCGFVRRYAGWGKKERDARSVDRCVIDQPCHVVLDVPPRGETYTLACFSATQAGNPLMGEFSFAAT